MSIKKERKEIYIPFPLSKHFPVLSCKPRIIGGGNDRVNENSGWFTNARASFYPYFPARESARRDIAKMFQADRRSQKRWRAARSMKRRGETRKKNICIYLNHYPSLLSTNRVVIPTPFNSSPLSSSFHLFCACGYKHIRTPLCFFSSISSKPLRRFYGLDELSSNKTARLRQPGRDVKRIGRIWYSSPLIFPS